MRGSLRQQLRCWPLSARLVLCLAVCVLIMSAIGNASILLSADVPLPGVLFDWVDGIGCSDVYSSTPTSWPAIREAGLRPWDCLLAVDGIPFEDHPAISAYLAQRADGVPSQRFVTVDVRRREEQIFQVEVPVMRFTLVRKLETSLVLIIAGLALYGTGLLILVAQPQAEVNRTLAAFLIIASLLVMGAFHRFEGVLKSIYLLLVVFGGRALLGPLLWHLAFIFPQPVAGTRLLRLRFAIYPVAPLTMVVSALGLFYLFYDTHFSWYKWLDVTDDRLVLLTFALGSIALFLRLAWTAVRPTSQRAKTQARLILMALVLAMPLSFADMTTYSFDLAWLLPRSSNLSLAVWLVPSVALVGFAMLRYQAFAYRGVALNALVVLMVSATLTQIYMFFFARRGWDGVQFVTIWGAVLLATLFWFVDSPVRRSFRRLFVRHEFDFRIANRFSQQMATTSNVDDALTRGARSLCEGLEVAWAAIASVHRLQHLWLADAEKPDLSLLALTDGPPESNLPGPPTLTHPMTDGDRPLGTIWLGPRITAEPIDAKDAHLVALLGQELARTLAVHANIEDLELVPGRILTAVENDRNRIGQDLHDSVLQFLGAIPLELDRAGRLIEQDPIQARAILDRAIDQAEIISQETRSSVYDLSPPLLLRHGVADAARAYAEQACARAGVQLRWSVDSEPVWRRLPETQATQVYRIVQQAVDNALAHASPTVISVRFECGEENLLAQVSDNGVGFDPASLLLASQTSPRVTSLGYISMQARAKVLAGTLSVSSTTGAGTTITLRFPPV